MYENKFPTGYLNDYKPTVTQSLHTVGQMTGSTYIVDYGIGECVYTYARMGKRIKQEVLQLIKCDMWKVITEINEKSPLSEGDLNNLNMEIREHSLMSVTEFINGRGHHQ
jgi:phospholipid N-methyltransferase